MSTRRPRIIKHRVGGWLPRDQSVLEAWIDKVLVKVRQRARAGEPFIHSTIVDFQNLIETDPEIWMGFHQMLEQVPTVPPYDNDPTGTPQIKDYLELLGAFDLILSTAPEYEQNDLVGFPINAILDWPMGTPGGLTIFLNPDVNAQFKKMFDAWTSFLQSPASCYVLTEADNGWFGQYAMQDMPGFVTTFVCDPAALYYGYTSWDDFFTRRFQDNVRTVEFPNDDSIVNNACESTVYRIESGVQATDSFWLKGEKYSLNHILNNDPLAPLFAGGTVFQAFLSALKYHRWHSPVNGTITKVVSVPGTYYAESPYTGFIDPITGDPMNPDPAGPNLSQAFITSLAARALIFITANNPKIGLMCFVAVGMAEVSTCEVTVYEGQQVNKGDELGMFHFGGSTHCLIFRPQTLITPDTDYIVGADVLINTGIATVA
jgi:phosphatidylserine decarboxylase